MHACCTVLWNELIRETDTGGVDGALFFHPLVRWCSSLQNVLCCPSADLAFLRLLSAATGGG